MKHQSPACSRVKRDARDGAPSPYSDHAPFHRVCFPLRRIIEFGSCAIEISSRANKCAVPRSATNFSFVSETSRRDDANMSPRRICMSASSAASERKEVKTLLGSAGAEKTRWLKRDLRGERGRGSPIFALSLSPTASRMRVIPSRLLCLLIPRRRRDAPCVVSRAP